MANPPNNQNKAQQQGKIIYYDPNPEGRELVPLEDLSIDVNLTTYRKPRSIIESGEVVTSTGKLGSISFLDGSEYGHNPNGSKSTNKSGEYSRSLTTNYTNIGTTFTKPDDTDLEGFGMTDIQIGFDTSYTPMVTIKFVDVRGGMLSQNVNSKYGVFFELPYPIFSLTVKGYYGKAVKYCLHMTKWNAKFNSDTGNFEITANFIGYTYAMLADMLMGYLKAVPKTEIGAAKFKKIKEEYSKSGVNVLTLDEMIDRISKLNENISEFKANSVEYEKLVATSESTNIVKQMKKIIEDFFIEISEKINPVIGDKTFSVVVEDISYNNLGPVVNNAAEISSQQQLNTSQVNDFSKQSNSIRDINNIIERYEKRIKDKVNELKKVDTASNPDSDLFKVIHTFNVSSKDIIDVNVEKFRKDDEYTKFEEGRVNEILNKTRTTIGDDDEGKTYQFFDLFRATKEINRILDVNCESERAAKAKLKDSLRSLTKSNDNFDPTIKNLIRIITIHCEVLLDTIMEVAYRAEQPTNSNRLNALLKLAPEELDRNPNEPIYAFPEYNKDGKERWLGSDKYVISADNVDEVAFVDDMLNALIKTKQSDINIDIISQAKSLDWFAINPIDTKINNSVRVRGMYSNPYSMIDAITPDEVLRQFMYRSFIHLRVGNVAIDDNLNIELAKFEAANMFYGVVNPTLRDLLAEFFNNGGSEVKDHFLTGSNKITNRVGDKTAIPYMKETSDYYVYDYISDQSQNQSRSYIPVDGDWTGEAFFKDGKLKSREDLANQLPDRLFLGNYVNSEVSKPYDGAKYLDILSDAEYRNIGFNKPTTLTPRLWEDYKKRHETKRPTQGEIENSLSNQTKVKNLNPLDSKFGVTEYFQIKAGGGESSGTLENLKRNGDNTNVSPAFYIDSTKGSGLAKLVDKSKTEVTEVGKNRSLSNNGILGGASGLAVPNVEFGWTTNYTTRMTSNFRYASLFGSPLYYAQNASSDPILSKAYLFINTFSLNGIKPYTESGSDVLFGGESEPNTLFGNVVSTTKTISGLFSTNGAFISTPTTWCYWVGSILWRDRYFTKTGNDPIVTKAVFNTPEEPIDIIPEVKTYPTTKELFYSLSKAEENDKTPMFLTVDADGFAPTWYKPVDQTLLNLPEQVKDEFITVFVDWATDSNGFIDIDANLSIYDDDVVPFNTGHTANLDIWLSNTEAHYIDAENLDEGGSLSDSTKRTLKNNLNYSDIIINKSDDLRPAYYELPNKPLTDVNIDLVNLMLSQSVIANYSPHTFRTTTISGSTEEIYIDKSVADTYYDNVAKEYKKLYDDSKKEVNTDNVKQSIFNSADNDKIKLNIYRYLASLNNKWVGEYSEDGAAFFPCGVNGSDETLASGEARTKTRLIDSFRFVDKSFKGIGDDFILNPKIISSLITSNYNQSFFNYIDRILADNNFQFIPLPTYVNINTGDGMEQIFKPYTYNEVATNSDNMTVGPSFVCVYVGQNSTRLDMGRGSHPNDGVTLKPNATRKYKGFDETPTLERGDMYVPVFGVNYAQQNQSYFKSLTLDQSEFTETDEGLRIIDDLSKSGNKNKATYVGQNLFNVYQTRSYTAKVEALGMPLIQPMMYFQLNNAPMFHGAYLIINTSHSITPNSMSTTFDGVRIKDVNPPLYEDAFEIMELLGDVDNCGAGLKYKDEDPAYGNDDVVVNNNGSTTLPIMDMDAATEEYYKFGYQFGYTAQGYKGESDFNRNSNTKDVNGNFLTYNDIFNRVSKITGVPVNTLKVMSVAESIVGKNKGPDINEPTAGGYVGLMQFQNAAATDVTRRVNNALFTPSNSDLVFAASVDTTNPTKKTIITPTGKWSKDPTKNNPTNNSFYDDFINALAGAYYAIQNVSSNAGSIVDVPRVYLSHNQGRGGYLNIRNNPTDIVNSNALNNDPPYAKPEDKAKRQNQEWLAAWTGRLDSVSVGLDPNFRSTMNDTFPNANKLRRVLAELGYAEQGSVITSAGADISSDVEQLASAIFRKVKELHPEINITVTAGNDTSHMKSERSRHKSGSAIDFTVRGADNKKIVQQGRYKKKKNDTVPNTYTSAQQAIINKVLVIIQGFTAGSGYPNVGYLDEYTLGSPKATGPHFHISYFVGGGTESLDEQKDSKQLAQAGEIQTYSV